MHVSLADIVIAYVVTFGQRQPGDMPYAEAGKLVQDKVGAKPSLKLFAKCRKARELNPSKSYEDIAELVKQFEF